MEKENDLKQKHKKMPVGIRILFILSFLATISSVKNLVINQPAAFDLFGSGFPKNYPVLWHLYSIIISTIFIVVVWIKSYKGWRIYLSLSIITLILTFLNQILFLIPGYDSNYKTTGIIFMGFMYLLAVLITYYIYRQKKYFNK